MSNTQLKPFYKPLKFDRRFRYVISARRRASNNLETKAASPPGWWLDASADRQGKRGRE
jgi:hypothetical protein